jgi:hypothetical protein
LRITFGKALAAARISFELPLAQGFALTRSPLPGFTGHPKDRIIAG